MSEGVKVRSGSRYGLVVATSMGVRLTPAQGQPVHVSRQFGMQATSAESNVASVVASLGIPVKVLTNFVKGSPISRFIKDDLASRGMEVEGPEIEQAGPWGYRHQFNIADSGMGTRGPRVHNDRAGEVGRLLTAEAFDLQRIFAEEGVSVLHLSGLIAALSPETSRFCVELANVAKRNGTLVSFDLNHRATFWEGREPELRRAFLEIAELSDILVGNEEDYQLCLGLDGPEAGGKDLEAKINGFKEMIERAQQAFPKTSVFATTLRQVVSVNATIWGAILWEGGNWHVVEPREIGVLDRIGGGDGFVGGVLYGILRGWDSGQWIQFGWANGALTTTLLTDYSLPMDEEQVWSVWSGNARVKR
jgi:2-dehydro-3-deoxygluconokinase